LILPSPFCHLAGQVTKSSSADALDSRHHVAIGNDPLGAKVAAATAFERSPTSGSKGTYVTLLALTQICLQEELAPSGSVV
jgi:hypothetical protein